MNAVRRTPPTPAPSRIEGTLKLRPRSGDDGAEPARTAPRAKLTRSNEAARRAAPAAVAAPGAQAVPDVPAAPASPPPEGVRLSKVMAERGLCSRREADEYIARGWVFVEGRRVSELGTRIDPDARVTLAPEATRQQQQRVTVLLNKPVGYVSGQPEPGYAPAVSLIGADNQFDRDSAQRFHPSHLKNLAPAGRLDIDSTGLLVLTQDGRVARQLIGDDSKVDKEYLVRVEGELAENGLALLNHGLWLDDRPLRPAQVEWINDDQLRFVLREGRKRQIRRMCELVGLKVVGLKRVRIGHVKLGDLPLGQWRFLRDDERF
ncbi:pseudouridine synthase [Thauera sp. WH-1]|uniref:pseudouridine synthase n=1 Tax=Thauera sp. WH-1 TaxID=3398230 RepID=UPI0039FDAD93